MMKTMWNWKKAMYSWWAQLAQVMILHFLYVFQVPVTCCENQCLPHCYFVSPAFKLLNSEFWTSVLTYIWNREDIVGKNTSTLCECAIRDCWCNNTNPGKSALYWYLTSKTRNTSWLFLFHSWYWTFTYKFELSHLGNLE